MKRSLSILATVFLVSITAIGGTAVRKQQSAEKTLRAEPPRAAAAPHIKPEMKRGSEITATSMTPRADAQGGVHGKPTETPMKKAGSSKADLRTLPQTKPDKFERPEYEEPELNPVEAQPAVGSESKSRIGVQSLPIAPNAVPAPSPSMNFAGLDFATWGAGHPPDTNGDVGPNHYIQTINTSLGVFDKSTGNLISAFTFNTFMSQGHFGNLCDTNNFGDPVVLYDTFEDRWVITDFAFKLDSGGNVVNPPGAYQCVAVSMTGDPVSGGWNYYSINVAGGLGDYPKFGVWPDGIYMSANMFGYPAGSSFQGARVFAFNKAQMYAGAPTVQVITFDAPSGDFTLLPSNARLQTGTPPAGTPNYFVSTWLFTNALSVYKFHVDWDKVSTSTFTGPDVPIAATSWPNASVPNAPSLGGNALDVLQIRNMMQNQYTNIGGVESLWTTHTVRRQNTSGFAAPRWYQTLVTGGTVAANITQATTWDPDGANVMYRFMPSVAIDRAGDLALGYSTSSSTTKPAIKYAGRLAGDPINTFSQTEQLLIQGAGTQVGNCGSAACTRWGDYSAMSLDPDGCTFWYTNMYYAADGLNHQTRIGSFGYPSCTPVSKFGGTLSGSVTSSTGNPIIGATITFGARVTTTNGTGSYTFSQVPAGKYASVTAAAAGFNGATAVSVVVSDGNTTIQNFTLSPASQNACFTDTTQSDFQRGSLTNVSVAASGDVSLFKGTPVDQQNTTLGSSGVGLSTTTWGGQTFTAALSGKLVQADINMFCFQCSGTPPDLTLSVRATSGGLPTGADLAAATIGGFLSGSSAYYAVTFSSPITVTAGTQYALVIRPNANPAGTYALTRSGTSTQGADVYTRGTRVSSTNSGSTWAIPLTGTSTTDAGFRTYIDAGFSTSGTLISSLKDSNPVPGGAPTWGAFTWSATTPAATSVKFQVAGSNSAFGPFSFVGPDGTASTFFTTSGASLAQFNGFRYLRYEAYLATTDTTTTPTLSDVTTCDLVTQPTTLTGAASTATYGGSATLTATLTNTAGGNALPNESVSFMIDGNSVGSATTDASGIASLTISLAQGVNAGQHTIGSSFGGDAPNYFSATGSSTLNVGKATATISVTPYSVTYNGDPHTATSTAKGVFSEDLSGVDLSGTTHTNFGTYSDSWSFTNANYADANGSVTDSIAKADATIKVAPYSVTYDGNAHTATGSAKGAKGEPLAGLDLSGTTHTDAGDYNNDTWTFTDVTGNYNNSTASVTDSIAKADATIKVTPYSVTYDANAHTAMGSAKGVKGETLAGLDLSGTTHTDAGGYNDTWTFTDVTGNYNNSTGSVTDSIGQANSTSLIVVNGYTGTYDGLAHGATGTATGIHGEDLSGLLSLGASFTDVPGGTAHWVFAGNRDYAGTSGDAAIVINQATLNVTANNAARIYGSANPTFSASYSGFANGQTLATSGVTGSPVFSTSANASSAPGTYPITIFAGTLAANNYSFNLINGTLTVYATGFIGLDRATIGSTKAMADSFSSSGGYPSTLGNNVLIVSNGTVEIGGARINGNIISSQSNVLLQPGSYVTGNVSAATTITNNKATVLGSSAQTQPTGAINAPAVAPCSSFTLNPALTGGTFTYSNGDLTISGNAPVSLANGSYCFHNVTISGQARLQVSGAVSINASGIVSVSGGGIVNTTHVPANLQIASSFTGPAGVAIGGGPDTYLTIYAPSTDVAVSGNASFFGAVLGKNLTLSGNPDAHLDTALPNIWASYFGF